MRYLIGTILFIMATFNLFILKIGLACIFYSLAYLITREEKEG